VTGDDVELLVDEDRVGPAELADGRRDLSDLFVRMGAGIAAVKLKAGSIAVVNL
jgi:hypothetical protein